MLLLTFKTLIVLHVIIGAIGLVAFWGAVATRKGSPRHRQWGFVFAWSMMIAGTLANGIATTSILAPLETHPDFTDAALARGLFGWMMLFLALFTVSLGYNALATIRNKSNPRANREPIGVGLQLAVLAAALNCAFAGFQLGQPLMMGLPVIGVVAAVTTLAFLFNPAPGPRDHLIEHVKSGVGAGISAYNAFLSVGLVRLFPEHAFNPAVWAAPILIGIGLILFYWRRLGFPGRTDRAAAQSERPPAEGAPG
jgi:hypothetical protein